MVTSSTLVAGLTLGLAEGHRVLRRDTHETEGYNKQWHLVTLLH